MTSDRTAYRARNIMERAFNGFKPWRGLATRYDKHAIVYAAASSSQPCWWLTDSGDTASPPPGIQET